MHFSTLFAPVAVLIGTAAAGINSVSFSGSGCPPGTIGGLQSDLVRTAIFRAYHVDTASPNADCQIVISFTVPAGWASTNLKADYRGYTLLASGAKTTVTSPGGGFTINGAFDDNYLRTITTVVSGAAGTTQTVTFNTAVALSGTLASTNYADLDSIDFNFSKRS